MLTNKKYIKFLLFLLLIVLASLIATKTILVTQNNLNTNNNWSATKSQVNKFVMGSNNFTHSPITLHRENLNLGAWHGLQEVLYKEPLILSSLDFDFLLEEDAYLYIIFNKTVYGFSAIRLSTNETFPSQYIEANEIGQFILTAPLDQIMLNSNTWNNAQLSFNQDQLFLYIGPDEYIIELNNQISYGQIGFRGSLQPSYIDNILLIDTNSKIVLRDDFANYHNFFSLFLKSLIAVIGFHLILYAGFIIFNKKRKLELKMVMSSVVLLICLLQFLGFVYFYATSQYPTAEGFSLFNFTGPQIIEKNWEQLELDQVERDTQYKLNQILEPESTKKVLFIGSSQTWGSGASQPDSDFVSIIENRLNQHPKTSELVSNIKSYSVFNNSISGSTSTKLSRLYEERWIHIQPDIVLVNLSNNDVKHDVNLFKASLRRIIELNQQANIETIFILEANSPEKSPYALAYHQHMIEVAKENNIEFLNLHEYLKQKNNTGIIWWDFVHLTDYGHHLTAEFLLESIDFSQNENTAHTNQIIKYN